MTRVSGWLSLILIVSIVASAYFIISNNSTQHSAIEAAHQMNAYMKGLSFTQYDPKGLVQSHLTAPLTQHYTNNDSLFFQKPTLIVYTNERIPWNIEADYGSSNRGQVEVNLWGHVKLRQIGNENSPETLILTKALTFYPQKSYVTSQEEVEIHQPGSQVKGKGIEADFKRGIVRILSESRGIYAGQK